MSISRPNGRFLFRYWKWAAIIIFIIICTYLFFNISKNAPGRYGAVIAQPELIEDARIIANKNTEIKATFGILQPHTFLNLINGEVVFSEDHQKVGASIKLDGDIKAGILDVWAHKVDKKWVYDSIFVRIKKPHKLRISVLEK